MLTDSHGPIVTNCRLHIRHASVRTPCIADRPSSAMESRLRVLAESSLDGAALELPRAQAPALAVHAEVAHHTFKDHPRQMSEYLEECGVNPADIKPVQHLLANATLARKLAEKATTLAEKLEADYDHR